jgi:ubiquinone/menaquinone biosynthesis C-methylase UbiE
MTTALVEGLQDALSQIAVLPGVSAWEYLLRCRAEHPELSRLLNPTRTPVEGIARAYQDMGGLATHFEGKLEGGRGDAYRKAQSDNYLIRSVGFLHLVDLAIGNAADPPSSLTVLDALGGNGTLTRIVRASRSPEQVPFIVTNDVSPRMVESALAQGLPATRQPLQDLIWFDDASFDAVVVAYGTHHIPTPQRPAALAEAFRVLKPGGHIVLQDFEIGCPTTRWYSDVLDRYTATGHQFDYFTRDQFRDLLVGNGFSDVAVGDAYDPFVVHADAPDDAKRQLLEYVYTLFALEKLVPDGRQPDAPVWEELESIVRSTCTFDPAALPTASAVHTLTVVQEGGCYRAEIPRVALVATGRRPPASLP